MWNDPAANTDGSAPAETPEQPEPAYESKQDEPSGLDPRAADPRRLEAPAPATDEEDPLASLPADFAAFSLTQTPPRSGDAKAEPFEQRRQQGLGHLQSEPVGGGDRQNILPETLNILLNILQNILPETMNVNTQHNQHGGCRLYAEDVHVLSGYFSITEYSIEKSD